MASTPSERALRAAVAQLAALSDDEVRGVLSHLDEAEVLAVTDLLAQASAPLALPSATGTAAAPGWALQRLGLPSFERSSEPASLPVRTPRVTPHALAALQDLVLELPQPSPSSTAAAPAPSGGGGWRRLWRAGAA